MQKHTCTWSTFKCSGWRAESEIKEEVDRRVQEALAASRLADRDATAKAKPAGQQKRARSSDKHADQENTGRFVRLIFVP